MHQMLLFEHPYQVKFTDYFIGLPDQRVTFPKINRRKKKKKVVGDGRMQELILVARQTKRGGGGGDIGAWLRTCPAIHQRSSNSRQRMSARLMYRSLFWTAVMLMKARVGDIIRSSTPTGNDLPLLELLYSGLGARVRLGGIKATTLAAHLTAEKGGKNCEDDKKEVLAGKHYTLTVQRRPLIFQL